jgi:hypothetical protein
VQQTTGLISTSITFFNKATLSVYDFPYSNTLTLGQMLFATVALYFMKSTNIISYKDFSFSTAKAVRHTHHRLLLLLLLHLAQPRRVSLCCDQVLPLAFFFFGMVVTGLAALQFINVPMFRCVKPSRLLQPQRAHNSHVVSLALALCVCVARQCPAAIYDTDRDCGRGGLSEEVHSTRRGLVRLRHGHRYA